MPRAKLTREQRLLRERERMYESLMQDVERSRRYIQREALCPIMNDTKWEELVSAMRSLGDFTPRYRQKHVRWNDPAEWDAEWYYHLRPFSVVEWVDIDPVDSRHKPPTDHLAEVERALRQASIPFSRKGPYLRVWGYTRPGTSPTWE